MKFTRLRFGLVGVSESTTDLFLSQKIAAF
jgi:hypothetical protein